MSKRNEALDIIRIFSLLCINGIHFFKTMGFYYVKVQGWDMLAMVTLRSLFMICVPMFITLSGYLMNQKTPTKKYFIGISKTIGIYFLCSLVYIPVKIFMQQQELDFFKFFKNMFNFSSTKYGWYIELYLGLYLLIPFLNMIFNNIKTKKGMQALLLTLFIVAMLPSVVNIYKFDPARWWLDPGSSKEYVKLIPSYWTGLYPIFYYFLGAYLSKYKPDIPIMSNLLFLLAAVLFDGGFNYYRSFGHIYVWGGWNGNSSATLAVITFLTFSLLLNIKFKKENPLRSRILKNLSDSVLAAYLLSGIFDLLFYDILNKSVPKIKDRFIYLPVIVLAVFACSLAYGFVVKCVHSGADKGVKRIINVVKNKFTVKPQNHQS